MSAASVPMPEEPDEIPPIARRPVGGAPGQLTTPAGKHVPVNVAQRGEDMLLVLLVDPGELLDAPEDLLLEAHSPRGLMRVKGTASRLGRDVVRFEVEGTPELIQRRQFVRVIAPQRVMVDEEAGDANIVTHSLNISGGGMLLSGPASLELDSHIHFKLYLDDRELPVIGSGRVVRAGNDGQRAVVFEEIAQKDRERLIHFLFERQRHARAVTRGDAL